MGKDDKGKEKSLEAYIQLSIGKTKAKSESYKDKNPVFAEQFIFASPISGSVSVVALSPVTVGSDKELGTFSFTLDGCALGGITEVICNFQHKKNNVTASVRLHVLVSPIPVPSDMQIFQTKVPRLCLILEKTNYLAGEVLRGVMVLTAGRELKCKATKVRFQGIQDFAKKGKSEATKDIVLVSGDIGLKDAYPPGEYVFPFAIQLPLNLPPSDPTGKYSTPVKDDSDENSYRHIYTVSLLLSGVKGGAASQFEATKPVHIFNDYRTIPLPPRDLKNEKQKAILVSIEPQTKDQYLFFEGENAYFNVTIQNNTKKKVKDMSVLLERQVDFKGTDKKEKIHTEKVKMPEYFPIGAGQTKTVPITIPINAKLDPTLLSSYSPVATTSYFVYINVENDAVMSDKVEFKKEIMVGVTNPPEVARFVSPTAITHSPFSIFTPPPITRFNTPPIPLCPQGKCIIADEKSGGVLPDMGNAYYDYFSNGPFEKIERVFDSKEMNERYREITGSPAVDRCFPTMTEGQPAYMPKLINSNAGSTTDASSTSASPMVSHRPKEAGSDHGHDSSKKDKKDKSLEKESSKSKFLKTGAKLGGKAMAVGAGVAVFYATDGDADAAKKTYKGASSVAVVATGLAEVAVDEKVNKGYYDDNGQFHEFDPNESAKSRMAKAAVSLTIQEGANAVGDALGDVIDDELAATLVDKATTATANVATSVATAVIDDQMNHGQYDSNGNFIKNDDSGAGKRLGRVVANAAAKETVNQATGAVGDVVGAVAGDAAGDLAQNVMDSSGASDAIQSKADKKIDKHTIGEAPKKKHSSKKHSKK